MTAQHSPRISTRIQLYAFPPGRRAFVMREVARRADTVGLADLAARAARAAEHDQEVLAMRNRRRRANGGHYGPDAVEMDNRVDHCIVGLYGHLESQTRLYRDMPQGLAATKVLSHLFPSGPGEITQLPYAQQHSTVLGLLEAAESEVLADDIAQLPLLPEILERVRAINEQYAAVLNAYSDVPRSEVVREAQAQGQDMMAEVYILILAHGMDGTPESVEVRDLLLEPIDRQNEAIRQARRRRRPAQDIDPDTGAELPEGEVPDADAGAGEGPGDDASFGAAGPGATASTSVDQTSGAIG